MARGCDPAFEPSLLMVLSRKGQSCPLRSQRFLEDGDETISLVCTPFLSLSFISAAPPPSKMQIAAPWFSICNQEGSGEDYGLTCETLGP